MHLLNCIVEYKVNKQFKCYNEEDHVDFPAKRLTADMAPGIMHNAYMKPDYKRPYFYINNISPVGNVTDAVVDNVEQDDDYTDSVKEENTRKANPSKVRLELRFGDDDSIFEPVCIYVDYTDFNRLSLVGSGGIIGKLLSTII